jgi:hypothetical protein
MPTQLSWLHQTALPRLKPQQSQSAKCCLLDIFHEGLRELITDAAPFFGILNQKEKAKLQQCQNN